jgi:hypothetical protein
MSVHKKLIAARMDLQGRKLNKSGHNKFAGYQYFELGDFLPAINEIFNNHGLCGVISYAVDIATLTITDIDDGSQIKITSPMAEAQLKGCHPIQNLGAVETYTRRYLWVTAMEIVEHDAIDSSEGVNEKPVKLPTLTNAEAEREYHKWMEAKSLCVDGDGDLSIEKQNEEWFKLPSNIRSAITRYGKSIALSQEVDANAKEHIKSI